MALATYTDLVSAIGDWLVRDDLATRAPDFIALCEARVSRELRVREMLEQATGSVSAQTLAVPANFVEVYRLTLDTASDLPLEYRPLEDSERRVAGGTSGQPSWYSILGTNFVLFPTPDGSYTYTLDYYRTIPALTATDNTNWLLTKAPDLYLFGALVEADAFLQNDGRVSLWESRFQAAKASLHAAEARAKRTSGPRRMRVVA